MVVIILLALALGLLSSGYGAEVLHASTETLSGWLSALIAAILLSATALGALRFVPANNASERDAAGRFKFWLFAIVSQGAIWYILYRTSAGDNGRGGVWNTILFLALGICSLFAMRVVARYPADARGGDSLIQSASVSIGKSEFLLPSV
jgi:hypothetical protein